MLGSVPRHVRRILWYLVAGTRGGVNRARIIDALRRRPYNPNQLAELLGLDYKTVRHHLEVLKENGVVSPSVEGKYGAVYLLSSVIEENIHIFDEIWGRIGKREIRGESG